MSCIGKSTCYWLVLEKQQAIPCAVRLHLNSIHSTLKYLFFFCNGSCPISTLKYLFFFFVMDYVLYISDFSCHYLCQIASMFQAKFFCEEQVSHTHFNLNSPKQCHILPLEVAAPFHQRCWASVVALLSSLDDKIALALSRNRFFVCVCVWFPRKISLMQLCYLFVWIFSIPICLFPYLSTSFL